MQAMATKAAWKAQGEGLHVSLPPGRLLDQQDAILAPSSQRLISSCTRHDTCNGPAAAQLPCPFAPKLAYAVLVPVGLGGDQPAPPRCSCSC